MKRIPYGISDYKTLIEKNYVFVDKTKYIEKLENYPAPYIFFLRPRRFGKSLFTSMLSAYFDISQRDNFERLFRDTYIAQNPTKERNGYYILNFNFSSLNTDTKESLKESFLKNIRESFDRFIKNYNLNVEYRKDYDDAASMLNNFFTTVKYGIDKPIYVIIDEYDHFANELLSFQPELFKDSISKTGFVRKFYEALKIGTEKVVGRIFATGVSPITLDSMTSGFNIADDLTRHVNFNEMMGFTEQEVRGLIKTTLNEPISFEETEELMEILKKNYNGYLFSEDATTRLFNSDMILYYIKAFIETGKGPTNLIDKNIASDYSKVGNLFKLQNQSNNMEVLKDIVSGKEVFSRITEEFSLEKRYNKDDFRSLLFYLGMLTIKKQVMGRVILKIPNEAIKGLYYDFFVSSLNELTEYSLDTADIENSIFEIALNGDNASFVSIIEKTLNKLSNRDFIAFDEKYIKIIMIAYLNLAKAYLIKSEYEVEEGYIDIALLNNHIIKPKYYGIIELKYITKKEYDKYGEALVNQRKEEAIVQINKYKNSQELLNYKNLKKWVLVFVCDKCVVNLEME
ncbi:ATP-binding protein [Clostridium tagluense]|uniref:ATP-binding protein n=1 Tax=Clostridium tagluense TaxID=360422 RepID=UPI001C6F1922|nr:ATP-binding protein [Clostridium tagluense]MBW9157753.1 ATP-binding protein [Clostridium tagluense]WLC66795.1 ATP-binding protein [Clostridium tagluense]